jgi:hypothetical protein
MEQRFILEEKPGMGKPDRSGLTMHKKNETVVGCKDRRCQLGK